MDCCLDWAALTALVPFSALPLAVLALSYVYSFVAQFVLNPVLEIAESLQQVKHKGGSCPPIRTFGMGDVTGDCGIFATCNPFQGF